MSHDERADTQQQEEEERRRAEDEALAASLARAAYIDAGWRADRAKYTNTDQYDMRYYSDHPRYTNEPKGLK